MLVVRPLATVSEKVLVWRWHWHAQDGDLHRTRGTHALKEGEMARVFWAWDMLALVPARPFEAVYQKEVVVENLACISQVYSLLQLSSHPRPPLF